MKAILFSLVLAAFGMYPETGRVIEVNQTDNEVVVETATGHIFGFRGAEDWEVGDYCSMVMHDNKTKIVADDIIVNARYSGF